MVTLSREFRIRREIPHADDDFIEALAALPSLEVDLIVSAMRQAKREALSAEADRRREARKYRRYDEDTLAERNTRIIASTASRAGDNLDALRALSSIAATADEAMTMAVAGLRANGYSDPEIARAIGVSRNAIGQRFGRKGVKGGSQDGRGEG